MSTPRINGFIRAKLHESAHFTALLSKISGLVAKKKNAFNVDDMTGKRFVGELMTNLNLTSDATKITFTYGAVNYQVLRSDVRLIKRLRCRKYLVKAKAVTVVP